MFPLGLINVWHCKMNTRPLMSGKDSCYLTFLDDSTGSWKQLLVSWQQMSPTLAHWVLTVPAHLAHYTMDITKKKEKKKVYITSMMQYMSVSDLTKESSASYSQRIFFLLKIHVKCNWGHHTHTHPHIQSLLFRWPVAMCSWKSYLRLQRYTINGFKSTLPEPNVSLIEASK